MQKVKALYFLLITLMLSSLSFEILMQEAHASPTSELLFEENFDSLTVNTTPHSFEWAHAQSNSFSNRSDCYFKVVDTVYNSTPHSFMVNDTCTASSVFGYYQINVDKFDYQNGRVQLFWQAESVAQFASVIIQGITGIASQYYFKADGNIAYYGGGWQNIDTWTTDTWYNVTVVFTEAGVDYWINDVQQVSDGALQGSHYIDEILIYATYPATGNTNVVYLDDINIQGETVAQTFYYSKDSATSWICTDTYRAKINKQLSSNLKGMVEELNVKTQDGSWVNTVTYGSPHHFHSESWYPPEGGGGQIGLCMITESGTVTVTETADMVEYYATVQDSYFNFTNTIWFFKEQPYIAFRVYRKMFFDDPTTAQKQVDFLCAPFEIEKYYYTNSSGVYSDTNDFSSSVTVELSSPSSYFPFYGYYFKQNYTVASIITYTYDSGGWLAEVYNKWNSYGSAYSEWEISFGQCASEGGTPTYTNQVEEVAGVLAIYQGDEASTNSVQSLSETLYADWSDLKDKIALEPTSDLYTATTRLIKSTAYEDEALTIEVNASSTDSSVTKVYCGSKGEPVQSIGADSVVYDSATTILTLSKTHSSLETLTLDWTPKHEASGYFLLTAHVKEGEKLLSDVVVSIKPLAGTNWEKVNATTVNGVAQFELPYGTYLVQAFHDKKVKTLRVWLTSNKEVGLDFGSPPRNYGHDGAVALGMICVAVAVWFLFGRRR